MTNNNQWPKAIFYDSKNTLWDWDEVWIDACKDLLEKYHSDIDPREFRRVWAYSNTGENHRTAFGKFRKFTETMKASLGLAFKHFGMNGDVNDAVFMTDRWKNVLPFQDTIEALRQQKQLVKVLCYSNVETEYLDAMVDKLGDARPHFVGDMDKSGCCKPSPRAYRWVLDTASRELGVDLNYSNVIYCAGPQWDVQGAMALGMKGCWVRRPHRTTPQPEGVTPDYIVDDLHGLTRIVATALGRQLAGHAE